MTKCSEVAYAKVLLHAAKYPADAISGLLLGTVDKGAVTVHDSLPVSHLPPELLPMLDVAVLQAKALAGDGPLSVVGYYAANVGLTDDAASKTPGHPGGRTPSHPCFLSQPGPSFEGCPTRAVHRLKDSLPACVLFQVLNSKVSPESDSIAIASFVPSKKGSTLAAGPSLEFGQIDPELGWQATSAAAAARAVSRALRAGLHRQLVDLDDHLQSIELDFANGHITEWLAADSVAHGQKA